MTYQHQFHHGYFGWLGAEPEDRQFATLPEAVAYLHAQTPGASRRIVGTEDRKVYAYMHKEGRIEQWGGSKKPRSHHKAK